MNDGALTVWIWFGNIALIAAFVFGTFFFMRRKYEKDIAPSAKHPQGQMVVEIWTVAGPRARFLRPIMPGGFEVEPPKGSEEDLRYFYTKSAVGSTKYPSWVPFDFLRASAPVASWYENHSVAIDPVMDECPHCHQEVVVAKDAIPADMQKRLQDTDALAAGDDLMREDKDRQKLLTDTLQSMKSFKYMPILMVFSIISGLGACILAFMTYKALTG
jgi:hypothetical protein